MAAAEKAAEEKQEYEQRTSFAAEDAMKNAAVEAAKKEQQYEVAMRGETYSRLLPPWQGRRRRWATYPTQCQGWHRNRMSIRRK